MLDLRRLLTRYRVEWRDKGSNCSNGFVNIACPLCKNDPSFHLRIHETGLWFYCLRNSKHRGRDLSYLAEKLKISPSDLPAVSNIPDPPKESVVACVSLNAMVFSSAAQDAEAVKYLRKRGFEYPEEVAEKFGLKVAKEGKWAARLLIPLTEGWTGRSMRDDVEPRYLAQTNELGFFKAGKGTSGIIVEGPLDALKLGAVTDNFLILAMAGGRISPAMLSFILVQKLHTLYVVVDNDVPISQKIELLTQTRVACPNTRVLGAKLPIDVKDHGEMSEHEVRQWLYTL